MSIPLAELIDRLKSDVPARDLIPDDLQCARLVRAAVADLGRRMGREKVTTLSIVSGTASYALPADFVKVIRLESLLYSAGVMHTAQGLVPVSQAYAESYTVDGLTITFAPTPSYSMVRYLRYQAGWALDAGDEYPNLSEEQAETLLLHAASGALSLQANAAAQQAWQYAIGDERVSKERLASELRLQAESRMSEYQARASGYNGPYGSRSGYAEGSYS